MGGKACACMGGKAGACMGVEAGACMGVKAGACMGVEACACMGVEAGACMGVKAGACKRPPENPILATKGVDSFCLERQKRLCRRSRRSAPALQDLRAAPSPH